MLAYRLLKYANQPNVQALALPRGGIPVALEVSKALNIPLDVFLVRKLGVPGHEELAMGAIASGGVQVLNRDVIESLRISRVLIEAAAARETKELDRRERLYRDDRPPPNLRHKTVILIDDGLATGSTMRAAVAALRGFHPNRVVVAVPTSAATTCEEFKSEVDEVICAETPQPFYAVGAWYRDFSEVTDDQVRELLRPQVCTNTL
jgi:predicted phosphoribosyltransferase